jgi:hypothetical protein
VDAETGCGGFGVTGEWQPIATTPHDGTDFLVWDWIEETAFIVHFSNATKREYVFYSDKNGWRESELSHWMPLPEGPK